MRVLDLRQRSWAETWELQEQFHAQVARGGEEIVLFVEHTPVITLGRQKELSLRNLRVNVEELNARGIDVVETDRGGNVTFHGPGQIVAYPIIRLSDHKLTVGGYVRMLQDVVVETLARCMVKAYIDPDAVGVWVDENNKRAKICAIGVRVRRGITLHGLALNVETDMNYFDLIIPCGLNDRAVTNMRRVGRGQVSDIEHVKWLLSQALQRRLSQTDIIEL